MAKKEFGINGYNEVITIYLSDLDDSGTVFLSRIDIRKSAKKINFEVDNQ
jgi:hypothetical protein